MRVIHLVLASLITISALLIWIAFSPELPFSTGMPDPDIAGISVGGDGLARTAEIGVPAYFLQAAVLLLITLLIALAVNKSRRTRLFWSSLLVIGALYQVVWWKIWSGHQEFLKTGSAEYFLGFVTPSAWMIFGIWLTGIGLLLLYVLGFRRFVFSEQDEAEYEAILAESTKRSAIPGDS